MSMLEETGLRTYSCAMATGLVDVSRLFPYKELASRVRAYL